MEMPLDGDKYDWLLNLQTLDFSSGKFVTPKENSSLESLPISIVHPKETSKFVFTSYLSNQLLLKAVLPAHQIFSFCIILARVVNFRFKLRANTESSQSQLSFTF